MNYLGEFQVDEGVGETETREFERFDVLENERRVIVCQLKLEN